MCPCLPASVSTHATPSSSALWASMGPLMQSPMAYTPGTLVAKFSPVTMRLALSSSTPMASRPRSSVRGRLPTDTRHTSASRDSWAPPAAGSRVRVTPVSLMSAATTLVDIMNLNLRFFLRLFWKAAISSVSIVGQILSMNSTTVTCAPSRAHTDPSSSPITPPPTMAIFSGTFSRRRAPVDDTQVLAPKSLKGMKGSSTGSEPVAMMVFLALMVCLPPSMRSTSIVLAEVNLPWPLT
mmetsp:Transcript_13086/g.32076  ORF Transcript_13086/g.32076 Transcript_13086/m.32076 type:complete len:238 (-) Transcript_13086:425-1138(-)